MTINYCYSYMYIKLKNSAEDMAKTKVMSISNVPEYTHREMKAFCARNNFTMAMALEVLLNVAIQAEENIRSNEASS